MTSGASYSLKQKLGVLAFDLPRLLPCLLSRNGWVNAANRQDRLETSDEGLGLRCSGRWSSDLHACHVFPDIGRRLMSKAFAEWPVYMEETWDETTVPQVSFVIPHRGKERLPLLHATIASIAAQRDVTVECIVVEQNAKCEVNGLPPWVRYVHLPHAVDLHGWHKSWAFNAGVSEANGEIVICHDGDILVPQDYGREVVRQLDGTERAVVHLQRFLFCLDESATQISLTSGQLSFEQPPERVRQNWQGGTLAIRKEAYWQIGGYDEDFVDWGGEDNEFYDRCLTLAGWRCGYLPFVHLWHEPQVTKVNFTRDDNLDMLKRKLAVPAKQRIEKLFNKRGQKK